MNLASRVTGSLIGAVTSTLGAVLGSFPARMKAEAEFFYKEIVKKARLRFVREGSRNEINMYPTLSPPTEHEQAIQLSAYEKLEVGFNLILVLPMFVIHITALYLAAVLVHSVLLSVGAILAAPIYGLLKGLNEGLMAGLKSPLSLFKHVMDPNNLMIIDAIKCATHFGRAIDWVFDKLWGEDNAADASNQELLTGIQAEMNKASEPAPPWLSADEINQYQRLTEGAEGEQPSDEQKRGRQRLADYQHYVSGRCIISLNEISEIEEPITFEGRYGERSWTRTFEASSLPGYINSCTEKGKHAFAPECKTDQLNDKDHVTYYKGLPRKIISFIQDARVLIQPEGAPAPAQPRRLSLDNHSMLFAHTENEPGSEEALQPGMDLAPSHSRGNN